MTPHTSHRTDAHADEGVLHDFVDGRLAADAHAAVQAHLDGCAACAARLGRLQALLAAARQLPRERAPEHDGWPALRAALAASPAPRVNVAGAWPGRRAWAGLAAAALLAVAAASWDARRGGVEDDGAPAASLAAVERDYEAAAAELSARLDATRDRLPPAAAAAVDRSLATIDDALAEARAALDADPGNAEIAHFVTVGYERKLDLLRRTTALSSGD